MDNAVVILFALVVLFLLIGLIKKLLWLCVVAAVIGCGLFITQPDVMEDVSSFVSSTFGGSIDPLKDNDYSDMIDDDIEDTPNKSYEGIGTN